MSSLAATLLAQSSGTVRTRQALIVTGLQNDFIHPDGKLPMSTRSGFIDRIRELVPAFREHGNIIWVWTEYRGNRKVNDSSGNGCMVVIPEASVPVPGPKSKSKLENDSSREERVQPRPSRPRRATRRSNLIIERAMRRAAELDLEADEDDQADSATASQPTTTQDPELFLSETPTREACCKPGTWGAEPIPEIKDLIDPKDIHITKSYYSAFTSTSLLLQLRAKLITDLYFAGCNTNLSVYATATDVARHGLEINIVQDCMGCRQMDRHEKAVSNMVGFMGAQVTTAHSVLSRLRGEELPDNDTSDSESSDNPGDEEESNAEEAEGKEGKDEEDENEQESQRSSPQSTAQTRPKPDVPVAAYIETSLPASVTSIEHAEPHHNESAADTDHDSSGHGCEEHQEATSKDRVGRRRVSTSEDIKSTIKEVRNCEEEEGLNMTGGAELTIRPQRLEPDVNGLQNKPVTHVSLPSAGTVPRLTQTEKHGSIQRTIHPPIVTSSSTMLLEPTQDTKAEATAETIMPKAVPSSNKRKKGRQGDVPTLGPNDVIGSGDSSILFDLLAPPLSEKIFHQLYHEVHWQRMYHAAGEVPRLVCCQGSISPIDGSMPIYRHPSDHSLPLLHWSPGIARVRREVERRVGHGLNHVLIQMYRNGQDYISEHSDKTLDIVPGSKIVNVSFGAQRTMRLRTKRATPVAAADGSSPPEKSSQDSTQMSGLQRVTQRIPLPHNSLFTMGLNTNSKFLHGIMPDKRLSSERSHQELAYNGVRISLTFRNIGTFLSSDSSRIWGQGARAKNKAEAGKTVNGDAEESQALIDAFGVENQSSGEAFDWAVTYGCGWDVLHLKGRPGRGEERERAMLFLSGDEGADLAVRMFLAYLGLEVDEVVSSVPSALYPLAQGEADADADPGSTADANLSERDKGWTRQIAFRDTDTLHTEVCGVSAILLYLDRVYSRPIAEAQFKTQTQAQTQEQTQARMQMAREVQLLTSGLLEDLRDVSFQDGLDVISRSRIDDRLMEMNDFLLDGERDCSIEAFHGDGDSTDENGRAGGEERRTGNDSTVRWLAGPHFGIADCAYRSLLVGCRDAYTHNEIEFEREFPTLNAWIGCVSARDELRELCRSWEGGKDEGT